MTSKQLIALRKRLRKYISWYKFKYLTRPTEDTSYEQDMLDKLKIVSKSISYDIVTLDAEGKR